MFCMGGGDGRGLADDTVDGADCSKKGGGRAYFGVLARFGEPSPRPGCADPPGIT